MKKLLALLLCGVLLTATGCAYAAISSQQPTYELYFREADLKTAAGRDALRAESIRLDETPENTQALASTLMLHLLEGPTDETMRSTIPAGTTLNSLQVRQGRAEVDLSAPYGTLSGVALMLADYAITLTLSQLKEISAVKITVLGQELAYREKQEFHEGDVLLSPKEDVVGTVRAVLYFPDSDGVLREETRILDLFEGDTQAGAVARALEQKPETKGLFPAFPEDFQVKNLWLEDRVCYVNLSSVLLNCIPEDSGLRERALEALCLSLCSLEQVQEVQFLVDGEFYETYRGLPLGERFIRE